MTVHPSRETPKGQQTLQPDELLCANQPLLFINLFIFPLFVHHIEIVLTIKERRRAAGIFQIRANFLNEPSVH